MKVILIAGLPGSGKTYLAETIGEVRDANGVPDFHVIDDIGHVGLLDSYLGLGLNAVVTDPNFCKTPTRELAEAWIKSHYPTAEIEWIFFENNPDECRKNVARRVAEGDDRKVEGFIKLHSDSYVIPEGHEVRPVYRQNVV